MWMKMPTSWDDTRFLEPGVLGELVVVARRDGNDWYVAVIGNEIAHKEFKLDLSQLLEEWAGHPALPKPSATGYLVHSYRDGPWKGRETDPFMVKVAPRKFLWLAPPKSAWKSPDKKPAMPHKGLEEVKEGEITVSLAPSGGHALYITPATAKALKEVE